MEKVWKEKYQSFALVLVFVLQVTSLPTKSLISNETVECSECGNSTLMCLSGHWSSVNCSKCLCSCVTDEHCSENEYCGVQGFSENGVPTSHACLYAPQGVEKIKITPEMARKRNIEAGLVLNETIFGEYDSSLKELPMEDANIEEIEGDNCSDDCDAATLCAFPCPNFPDAVCIPDVCSCTSMFDLNGTEPLCYGDPNSDVEMEEAPENYEDWFAPDPTEKEEEKEKPEEEISTSSLTTTMSLITTSTGLLATETYFLATETSTSATAEQDVTTATTEDSTATTVATPTYFLLQMVLLPVVLLLVAMTTVLVVRKIYQNLNKKTSNSDETKPNDQELETLKPLKTEEV